MSEKALFDLLVEINVLCATRGLSDSDRLELFELAWMATASNIRTAALALPGGFPTEQASQVDHLEQMAALVRFDSPDLEMERLFQEGDIEGVLRHLQQLQQLQQQMEADEDGSLT